MIHDESRSTIARHLSDGLGSTMAMVDGSGTVVKTYGYDVYGKVTSSSGSAPNEFDFAGQQTDPTGLQYLRARYYDPGTGRFLSRDPLRAVPVWSDNSYSYASGRPVSLVDPTGLFGLPKIVKQAAGGVASAATGTASAIGSTTHEVAKAVSSSVEDGIDHLSDKSVWGPIAGAAIIVAADVPGVLLAYGCIQTAGVLCPIMEIYDVTIALPATYIGLCLITGDNFAGIPVPGLDNACSNDGNSNSKVGRDDEITIGEKHASAPA